MYCRSQRVNFWEPVTSFNSVFFGGGSGFHGKHFHPRAIIGLDLELKCCDYRLVLPWVTYVDLGIKHRALCTLPKHSDNLSYISSP